MSQTTSKVRWTIQDVAALPDNEWIRYEILDGELFAVRSPHHKHQHVIGCIFSVLNTWSLETGLGEPSIMPGLIFSDSDNVAPDVVWVSYERLAQIQDEAGHFEGIGKPEALRENLAGFWSRRIDDTNRLVYAVDDEYLTIIACRYHY